LRRLGQYKLTVLPILIIAQCAVRIKSKIATQKQTNAQNISRSGKSSLKYDAFAETLIIHEIANALLMIAVI
jgi:hypothetical protein